MLLAVTFLLLALVLALRAYWAMRDAADRVDKLQLRVKRLEDQLAKAGGVLPSDDVVQPRSVTEEPSRGEGPAVADSPRPIPAPALRGTPAPTPAPAATSVPSATTMGRATTLESEIGSRWMLIAGVIVLVLGVAFFVKYAFDRQWINETARVAGGTVAGVAVWALGLRFVGRRYVSFGRMIAGAGLAMMFVSAWAAGGLYEVVSTEAGFVWVALIAAVAAMTADRQRSLGLALVALIFAYAAPFLLPGDAGHHLVLFTYETLLAIAALVLVRRHGWPALGLASWWATWTTVAIWLAESYRDTMFVSTELYLIAVTSVFAAMIPMYRARPADPIARIAAYVLCAGPVFFHLASLYVLFAHSLWFLTYLIAATAACVALASGRAGVRLAAWGAAAWPFVVWLEQNRAGNWLLPAMVTTLAIYVIHFIPPLLALRCEDSTRAAHPAGRPLIAEYVLFQCNGLGTFLFAYLLVDAHAGSTPLLAAGMAGWYLFLAWTFRGTRVLAVPHALATAFTLGAITIALQLTGPWVTAAYAAEGAAMIAVGLHMRVGFFRLAGALFLAASAARLVNLQFGLTPAAFTPLVNSRTLTGAFVVALLYGIASGYRRSREWLGDEAAQAVPVATVVANLLTLGLLTADVSSFWTARPVQLTADFSRELSISVTWAAYAMALIWIGFARDSATLRYLALALFGITVAKMFAIDLLELDGIYRITGFIALGLVLLAASFLYHWRRTSAAPPAATG